MAHVLLGDGLTGLDSLEAGSVSLVLSDLPSGQTVAEFDRAPDLPRFWEASWRALKPDGLVVVMASSIRFAADLVGSQPKAFRYDLIWEKALATGFLNARIRPLRAHEFILVFSQSGHTYNPQMVETGVPISLARRQDAPVSENYGSWKKYTKSRVGATDRYPRSVLHFSGVSTRSKDRVHPQQ